MPGGNGQKPERPHHELIPIRLSILKPDPHVLFMGRVIGKGMMGESISAEEFDLILVETNPPSFMVKVGGDRYILSSLDLMKAVAAVRAGG